MKRDDTPPEAPDDQFPLVIDRRKYGHAERRRLHHLSPDRIPEPPELPANWPPFGWETVHIPIDGSIEAARQWLAVHIGLPFGALYFLEKHYRDRRRDPPDAGSDFVRDAYRLVAHLRLALGRDDAPTKPAGKFTINAAIDELEKIATWLESPAEPEAAKGDARQPGKAKRGGKRATVNERMAGTLTKNSEAMGWKSDQWAKHLKCAKSTVVETSTWKKLKSARLQAKAERMTDRRRKPKASEHRRK